MTWLVILGRLMVAHVLDMAADAVRPPVQIVTVEELTVMADERHRASVDRALRQ